MIYHGALPSPPDSRDYVYSKMVEAVTLPSRLLLQMPQVRNQNPWGTCVAFAAAGVKDFQETTNYPGRNIRTSPLFIYSECKKQDGIPDTDGTYPRVAMSVLKNMGVCLEKTMPYNQMAKPVPEAPRAAYDEAKQFQIGTYARIYTLEEIKQAIHRDGPVLCGLYICSNFLEPQGGFLDLPEGTILGGHAVVLCGWDDNLTNGKHKGFFRLHNSWGIGWGDRGQAWLPYNYLPWRDDLGRPFFMEAWSSVDVILPPPTAKKVEMWVGKDVALVDGAEVKIDQSVMLEKTGRTMVPVRFLAENFGYYVEWDGVQQKVTLTKVGV